MRIFALAGTQELGGAVAREAEVALDPHEEREFPGGEHKSRPLVSVRNEDVYVLHSLHGAAGGRSPADRLIRLLFFLAACRENGARRVTAVVPYLPYIRKDQQTKPRDPVTSRYLAALFEAVKPDVVVTLEAHNKAAFQNAFRCTTVHLDMRHLFAGAIAQATRPGALVLLSPDSGGMKRVQLLRETFVEEGLGAARLAIMEKRRSDDLVTGDLFAGDVAGADVVILDDMIATGGTILRAAKACMERGAARVFAVATHGLFNEGAEALFSSGPLHRVLVSDSVAPFPLPSSVTQEKLQLVSCAPLLAGTIKRLHGGGSIDRLLSPAP